MSDEQEVARGRGRKLKDLNPRFGRAPANVQELTVKDLEQLAEVARSADAPTGNLGQLSVDDLKALEDAFHDAKLQAAPLLASRVKGEQGVAASEEEELFWNSSCCCCTPCCCCAAADVDPFG